MEFRLAATVFAAGMGLGILVYLPLRRDMRSLGRQFGIDRWVAWGFFALSIAGIASITAVSGSFPENSFLTIGVFVVYLFGWFGLIYAVSNYGVYRHLDAALRTDTGAVGNDTGHVAVSGAATPVDRPATTPLLGQEAVCYTWLVEVHRRWPHAGWYTTAIGQGGVPFRVDDGSGPVVVVPDGAEFRLASGIQTRQVDADESPPADAVEFLSETGVKSEVTERTHRYEERYVPEGETVYVLGTAHSSDTEIQSTDATLIDRGEPFVIGTGSVETATRRLGRTVRIAGLGGAVAVLFGYLGQLFASGVIPS